MSKRFRDVCSYTNSHNISGLVTQLDIHNPDENRTRNRLTGSERKQLLTYTESDASTTYCVSISKRDIRIAELSNCKYVSYS